MWSRLPNLVTGLALGLAAWSMGVDAVTCGELKTFYKNEQCCGQPTQEVSAPVPGTAACPYSFAKPACSTAEPQTPRDLTAGAVGSMTPKAATLTDDQANFLPLVNVHFHLGAEHKTEAYSDDTDSIAYDAASSGRRLAGNVRPGFMCSKSSLNANQLAPYNFTYCKGDVQVGKSYEIHYVHSSAGMDNNATDDMNADLLADGLGGAANGRGLLNPMIVVQGQIFQIVNGAATVDDMLHGWTVVGHDNSVMYPGSTTGQSHDNEVCSPYSITWHVDKDCHQVSPESFDNLCKQMSEAYGMYADLYPHGSRKLVSSQYVVKSEKNVNPEGVGASAVEDIVESGGGVRNCFTKCCRKAARQLRSIAGCDAARLDLGNDNLGSCQSTSSALKELGMHGETVNHPLLPSLDEKSRGTHRELQAVEQLLSKLLRPTLQRLPEMNLKQVTSCLTTLAPPIRSPDVLTETDRQLVRNSVAALFAPEGASANEENSVVEEGSMFLEPWMKDYWNAEIQGLSTPEILELACGLREAGLGPGWPLNAILAETDRRLEPQGKLKGKQIELSHFLLLRLCRAMDIWHLG
ncbi:unnamed protein product [Symbiodinium sp. CCMP2592]|nr:unnamed protein product [Symbiodinium sp. CCMP2592]